MFSNIMRISTCPYIAIVPVDCSIHMKCFSIRKSWSVEVGLAFANLDQLKFKGMQFQSFAKNIMNS